MFGPNVLTNDEVRELIRFACERCGVVGQENRIKHEWNTRYTRRMGCAYGATLIKLSVPLFLRATREEQRTTVIHEACHCIAHALYGNVGHGPQWKRLMVMCGLPPARCHNVDRTGLKRKTSKYVYKCNCREHKMSAIRHKRTITGRRVYRCNQCLGDVVYTGVLLSV